VQVGGVPVFRFYYTWGGGEGSHTTFTLLILITSRFPLRPAPSGCYEVAELPLPL